jgi:hypothetical protein
MTTIPPISLDDKNRLVLSRSAAERLSRGRLKVTSSGRVSEYADGTQFPDKVALDGTWKLNETHDLEFSVRAYSDWLPGTTLTFKTGVISANGNELVFSARISDGDGGALGCAFAFGGKWQADKNNRLTFEITRFAGRSDKIVFQGAWQIGKNAEIFYSYSDQTLKTKDKEEFFFGLKGSWALGARRIAYRVEGSSDSVLTFSAALETPSIVAKDGEIRYAVGVRFTVNGKEKLVLSSVAIFGTWKLGKDLSVGFEIKNTAAGRNVLTFSAEKAVLKGGTLTLGLKTENGKKFGAEVKFTKAFSKDIQMFVEYSRSGGDDRILGGITGKF